MIHNWGTRQGANNTTTYHVDKQLLFSHEAFINPTSLESRSASPHMLIASSTESAWIFDVDAKLPTAVRYREKEGAPLPPSFIRSERGSETSTSLVSYHFKITGANEKTFSRDERWAWPFAIVSPVSSLSPFPSCITSEHGLPLWCFPTADPGIPHWSCP